MLLSVFVIGLAMVALFTKVVVIKIVALDFKLNILDLVRGYVNCNYLLGL
jgi:hypothetical protein